MERVFLLRRLQDLTITIITPSPLLRQGFGGQASPSRQGRGNCTGSRFAEKKIFLLALFLSFVCAGCGVAPQSQLKSSDENTPAPAATSSTLSAPNQMPLLTEPISGGLSRVTKKPFGIYVSPGHSPVTPERFTGYHTGIDFETTPAEQNTDVPIYAACAGKLLLKEYASGYGGVAVQACVLDGQNVTIIYGHLRLSSITPNVGGYLTPGQQIAVLGTGYSSETDGERKHLHFGIHKGTAVNILGYVQKQDDLSGWLDPTQFLR
jgi:murein DD-endopeptidase MepM/ murein hydrolase activator NlpD